MKKIKPIKYNPNSVVLRRVKEYKSIPKSNIEKGMFVYMYYRRTNPRGEDKPRVLVRRLVFVLNENHNDKLHAIDVSQFKVGQWKLLFDLYIAEKDPRKFAEKLEKGMQLVNDNVSDAESFYYGTLKIPLSKLMKPAYRTFTYKYITITKETLYRTDNNPPLNEIAIREIMAENNITNYSY